MKVVWVSTINQNNSFHTFDNNAIYLINYVCISLNDRRDMMYLLCFTVSPLRHVFTIGVYEVKCRRQFSFSTSEGPAMS